MNLFLLKRNSFWFLLGLDEWRSISIACLLNTGMANCYRLASLQLVNGVFPKMIIGSTLKAHHFSLRPQLGKHLFILVDDAGGTLQRQIEIISTR